NGLKEIGEPCALSDSHWLNFLQISKPGFEILGPDVGLRFVINLQFKNELIRIFSEDAQQFSSKRSSSACLGLQFLLYLGAVEGKDSEVKFDFVKREVIDPGFIRNHSRNSAQGVPSCRLAYGVPPSDLISDFKYHRHFTRDYGRSGRWRYSQNSL